MTRLTFAASVYLVLVALLPDFLISGVQVRAFPWVWETGSMTTCRPSFPRAWA